MTTAPEQAVKFPFELRALDVPEEFAALRADRPVLRVELPFGGEGWLVSRYEDVRTVLSDPRFSRAETIGADIPRTGPARTLPGNLLAMDPPEHSRVRRLVAGAFGMRSIGRWRPRVEQVVAELITAMTAAGAPADLVEHFAMPLPVTVVCELLGVPVGDRRLFQRFAEILFSTTGATAEEMAEAGSALEKYLVAHIEERRQRPRPDLISQLIAARDEDEDRLSEQELIGLAGSILVAGHESTANEVSNFVYTLLSTGLWADLVARPELVDAAVEELLRFVALGSGYSPPRIATEDLELGGRPIHKGESVIANIVSANRDESVFDRAAAVDLDRAPNPHLSFGFGPHHCLGAQLARLELRVAFDQLVRRLPGLRLAGTAEDVPWRLGTRARGPRELLVRW